VFRDTCRHKPPVGRDDLRRQQVIGYQSVFPAQRTIAAGQREPGEPHAGDGTRGCRQPVPLRRAHEVARRGSALDARHTPRRVDGNRSHPRTIDHDTIVAQGSSRKIMSSTPDGERHPMRARPTNGVNNVLGIRAASERRGAFVYLPIPKLTHLIIIGAFGKDDIASEERCEILGGTSRIVASLRISQVIAT